MSSPPHPVSTNASASDGTPLSTVSSLHGADPDDGVTAMRKCSHTFAIQISGCMNAFSHIGPDSATWRVAEGKHPQVFGLTDGLESEVGGDGEMTTSGDLASATSALMNANIKKATLIQSHNTFPVPLGVSVSCLPKTEAVDTGERYTFTTIPNTTVTHPQTLYEAGEAQVEATAWRATFPTFNAKNLETQGVLTLNNCPYVFVNEKHPAINLLRANKGSLGVDIDTVAKMDGEWYKLSRPLMSSCCDTIRTKVLSKFETRNLADLSVSLKRLGGQDWSAVEPVDVLQTFNADPSWDKETLKSKLDMHTAAFTQKPATFMARLHLEYEVPITKG